MPDRLRSLWNFIWFAIRNVIKFRRGGYTESSPANTPFVPEAEEFNKRYEFSPVGQKLFPRHWIRSLATLWCLEQMLGDVKFPAKMEVLEPCCQDFSRLPALRTFFSKAGCHARFTGVEIDAYVPLSGFHSRWDHADYYLSLNDDGSEYHGADFFKFLLPSEMIICFYPFISSAPALAWGMPAHVANAKKWVESFEHNLKPGGLALVIHQGDWEEKDFDRARVGSHLVVEKRRALQCPFFQTKHPMHATLYRKVSQ